MKKIAVMLANGFEEGEALFTIDILRRAGFECNSVSIGEEFVTSSRKITVKADKILGESKLSDYDMIVLPGGQPGATNLSKDARVLEIVRNFLAEKKFVAAICAAPMVLKSAGVSAGKKLTSYPGEDFKKMFSDANYIDDELVVQDENLITSRGPATVFHFAYKLIDVLGGDFEKVAKAMLFDKVF